MRLGCLWFLEAALHVLSLPLIDPQISSCTLPKTEKCVKEIKIMVEQHFLALAVLIEAGQDKKEKENTH